MFEDYTEHMLKHKRQMSVPSDVCPRKDGISTLLPVIDNGN